MADRASYVVRSGASKRPVVRFNNWGSSFLLADIFWGPEPTLRQIETLERGEWLDDVYGEAVVAIDLPSKRMGFYTYQLDARAAEVAVRLMKPLWPGWKLSPGSRLSDVARVVGVDFVSEWKRDAIARARQTATYYAKQVDLGRLGTFFAESASDELFRFSGILSVRERGRWVDRFADLALSALSGLPEGPFAGPPLLDAARRLPTYAQAKATLARLSRDTKSGWPERFFYPGVCAAADPAARTLAVTVWGGITESVDWASAHAYRAAWPGWRVTIHRGGVAAHYARTGRQVPPLLRAPPSPLTTRRQHVDRIRELLFSADERRREGAALLGSVFGPGGLLENTIAQAATAGHVKIRAGRGSSQAVPASALDRATREQLWARAVARS